ncbi:hypothetical protein ABVB72_07960 [Rhizobium nepotum]
MRSSGSTVISVTDVLAAYNGHDKRRGKPRFFFLVRCFGRSSRNAASEIALAGNAFERHSIIYVRGGLASFPGRRFTGFASYCVKTKGWSVFVIPFPWKTL